MCLYIINMPKRKTNKTKLNHNGTGIRSFLTEGIRRVRNVFKGPANKQPGHLTNILNKYGNLLITKLYLGKKPLSSAITAAGNLLSGDALKRAQTRLGYDEIFHNYLLIQLANGEIYKTEKNHYVELKLATKNDFTHNITAIPITTPITLRQMIDSASKHDWGFWRYSPTNRNCQLYTSELINRSNLVKPDSELAKIVEPQNAAELVKSLPVSIQHVPQLVTDLAGAASRLYTGDGIETHCLVCKVPTDNLETRLTMVGRKKILKSRCAVCDLPKVTFLKF
jgi:hypothetical protein